MAGCRVELVDILLFDCTVMVMVNYSYWKSLAGVVGSGYLWLKIFTPQWPRAIKFCSSLVPVKQSPRSVRCRKDYNSPFPFNLIFHVFILMVTNSAMWQCFDPFCKLLGYRHWSVHRITDFQSESRIMICLGKARVIYLRPFNLLVGRPRGFVPKYMYDDLLLPSYPFQLYQQS